MTTDRPNSKGHKDLRTLSPLRLYNISKAESEAIKNIGRAKQESPDATALLVVWDGVGTLVVDIDDVVGLDIVAGIDRERGALKDDEDDVACNEADVEETELGKPVVWPDAELVVDELLGLDDADEDDPGLKSEEIGLRVILN
ncbi:hypothetical protein PHLCEN_2v12130 [Hermanssonia centrifuga]|uniref:Uncharacterized protein n=1 Tax=Hermanssonia centrifuga TaxID=98765 RepID=A0A2R6NHS5_9APHY|nr:hypothetical protein PHLCEN_2v12130 [Hermanssonia centrifuga]